MAAGRRLLASGRRLRGRVEAAVVGRWGTSPLALVARTPVLVLETTGRRTGRRRRTVVAYRRDGDDLLIVGAAAGQRAVPDWVANLRAGPAAAVVVGGRRRPVRGVELRGDERAAVWPDLCRHWPRIARYQRRAGRPVPVFRLTRR